MVDFTNKTHWRHFSWSTFQQKTPAGASGSDGFREGSVPALESLTCSSNKRFSKSALLESRRAWPTGRPAGSWGWHIWIPKNGRIYVIRICTEYTVGKISWYIWICKAPSQKIDSLSFLSRGIMVQQGESAGCPAVTSHPGCETQLGSTLRSPVTTRMTLHFYLQLACLVGGR